MNPAKTSADRAARVRTVGGLVAEPGRVSAWRGAPPTVDPERILRLQGYPDLSKVRPAVRARAQAIATEAVGLIAPEASCRRLPIERLEDGKLTLAGGITFRCPAFDRLLKGCSEIAAFVITLGRGIEEAAARRLESSEVLDAYFLEMAGWLAIEAVTRDFARDLKRGIAGDGLTVTFRLGPGYAYQAERGRVRWELDEQRQLFALFEGVEIPVELTESCAMLPKMSRSGIFGVAPGRPAR